MLFAILLFGGLWGIAGMIVGVPLFAMIYRLLKDYLELRLYHKSLSMETDMYKDLKRIRTDVNGDKHYVLYTKQEKRNANLRRDAENKISLLQLLTQKPIEAPAAEGKTMTGDSESGEEPDRKAEEQFSNGELSETDKTEKQAENSETGK